MSVSAVPNPEASPEPLISILVPSYNHEKYVIECLESINSLNYRRIELVLSDDFSRDNTFVLAEQWAKRNEDRFERTLIVRQENNVGLIKNLQFLFDNAQGEYLAYIASDDLFVESALSCRMEIFQNNRNIDAVFGNAKLISNSGEVLKERFIPRWIARELSSRRLLVSSLLLNWRTPGPVMMLRRDAVFENGSLGILPIDLHGEDKYIYIRLAARGRLQFIDAAVAKYRVVEESFSRLPSRYSSVLEYNLQSDKKNRHLLAGFDRCALEARIARFNLELNKGSIASYKSKRLFLRLLVMLLKVILFQRALFYRAWSLVFC